MTLFIIGAALLSLLAGAFVAQPLWRSRGAGARTPQIALAAALALIGAAALLYLRLGNRGWSDTAVMAQTHQSIPVLARRLERNPQDMEGWLALGEAYSQIARYSMAERSFERANRLAPAGNAQALAGIAESLLLGGDRADEPVASQYLERALRLDPKSPKALFYGAVDAYQQGRLELARERFAAMLTLSPPESVRVALQRQIEQIDKQMRDAQTPAAGAASDAATAIHLHVTLAPALADKVPPDASLFIFVRAPEGGAPLAVKRSSVRLPQDLELSAADAMIAGHGVQPGQSVTVVARISVSGSPLPQGGDLYGEIKAVAGHSGSRALQIDRLSP
jgi:cytochrome c-type biogenesis protein CcmH